MATTKKNLYTDLAKITRNQSEPLGKNHLTTNEDYNLEEKKEKNYNKNTKNISKCQ